MIATILKAVAKAYPMAKRGLYHFHGGIFPRYNKSISKRHPVHEQFIPKQLILPLQQHIGVETESLVKVGEKVQKNQLIADTQKGLSAPVHAPTSGTVIAIEKRTLPHASGLSGTCIVIKTDQQNTTIENSLAVNGETPTSPEALKNVIHRAGIVGMGGAGFPTFAKLPKAKGKIHTLLVNGAECEPFITCDDLLMQQKPEEIIQGALIVAEALGCQRILCGIEDNKPDAIRAMQSAAQNTIFEIHSVPTVYPMGGQKQLTQELVQIEVPAHQHSVDIGLLMMNVATFTAIYQAVKFGNPLTSRLLTVSGLGLKNPFNIDALLGTSFEELAQLAEPQQPLDYPLIQGGPMMGVEMPNNQVPVIKTTNCVLANPPSPAQEPMPCIRCGECMDACPINLLPQQMYWHTRSHEFEKVDKLKVFDCIECGCCSFVCPSHIPLVQYYRFAKSEIKLAKREEEAIELAKERHEAKLAREERIKAEREARLKAKKEEVKKKAAEQADSKPENQPETEQASVKKSSAGAAAAARAAAARKKAQSGSEQTPAEKPISAREKAIAAAQKRAEKAKQTNSEAEPTNNTDSPKKDARQAAVEAARKRAAAKKAEQHKSEKSPSSEADKDLKKAVMQAARKSTESENKTDNTESVEKPLAEGKPVENKVTDKRQAAIEAARKRKEAQASPEQTEAKTPVETSKETTPTDKRKAAMEAAKRRAQTRKQNLSDEHPSPPTEKQE